MPLTLNAIGLVAFLGGHSLDVTLGSLAHNWVTEYLPLFAGHLVPTDRIAEPITGFIVYNVSAAIKTREISPWFARWLLAQVSTPSSIVLEVKAGPDIKKRILRTTFSIFLGVLVHSLIIAAACFLEDEFGLVAAGAMTVSTISRVAVLQLYRAPVNAAAVNSMMKPDPKAKVLLELPGGKMVTVHTPSNMLVSGLITEYRPRNKTLHSFLRTIGYIALGCFIYAIGDAGYLMQLLILLPTSFFSLLASKRVGFVNNRIGTHISIGQRKLEGIESRARMYAELELDDKEEEAMTNWHLFPQRSNEKWWAAYRKFGEEHSRDPKAFDKWPEYMAEHR